MSSRADAMASSSPAHAGVVCAPSPVATSETLTERAYAIRTDHRTAMARRLMMPPMGYFRPHLPARQQVRFLTRQKYVDRTALVEPDRPATRRMELLLKRIPHRQVRRCAGRRQQRQRAVRVLGSKTVQYGLDGARGRGHQCGEVLRSQCQLECGEGRRRRAATIASGPRVWIDACGDDLQPRNLRNAHAIDRHSELGFAVRGAAVVHL